MTTPRRAAKCQEKPKENSRAEKKKFVMAELGIKKHRQKLSMKGDERGSHEQNDIRVLDYKWWAVWNSERCKRMF